MIPPWVNISWLPFSKGIAKDAARQEERNNMAGGGSEHAHRGDAQDGASFTGAGLFTTPGHGGALPRSYSHMFANGFGVVFERMLQFSIEYLAKEERDAAIRGAAAVAAGTKEASNPSANGWFTRRRDTVQAHAAFSGKARQAARQFLSPKIVNRLFPESPSPRGGGVGNGSTTTTTAAAPPLLVEFRSLKFDFYADNEVVIWVDAPVATESQIQAFGASIEAKCPLARFRRRQIAAMRRADESAKATNGATADYHDALTWRKVPDRYEAR